MDPIVKTKLLNTIDDFLEGRLDFASFFGSYYEYVVERVPDDALSVEDFEFFGAVQEKLDWTDENPDAESRSVGWISADEFHAWLMNYRNQLR